ncbi:hypothetical protein [Rhodococcus sp. 06-1474-1B]|uniref:hypothetical protein n=1 Tax=Rhodococcus sp. 06-1474-1B TaxID=2022499 RepID=UPI0020CF86C4|nr:hypothetical protein [Rhodococcus sp. 06-1474-1B]
MTTQRPMQPPDKQPIGFWTVRAGEAVRARTRGVLRDIGITQAEWWLLHQISLHPAGADRAKTIDTIGHNDTPERDRRRNRLRYREGVDHRIPCTTEVHA